MPTEMMQIPPINFFNRPELEWTIYFIGDGTILLMLVFIYLLNVGNFNMYLPANFIATSLLNTKIYR